MSQALYRKWRPQLWDEVVGQAHITRTIQNAIHSGKIGHAYLFAGPRGTGKTTTARLLAKAVNCLEEDLSKRPCNECAHCLAVNRGSFMDLIEVDAASNTSVDDVRDLRDKINFSPSQGKYKVYIIDEVHMLSTAAFNALLKTLEEPPVHAIFVLATTEVHKIPATVLSRCQRHEFRRIPVDDIVSLLKELAIRENLQADDDALLLIARQSTGSLRDGISLLDQLSSTGETITLELAQTVLGTATNQIVIELIDSILSKDPTNGLQIIHRSLDGGSDPRQFARQIVEYLRSLLLVHLGNASQVDETAETKAKMAKHAEAFGLPWLLTTIQLFNDAASDRSSSWHPGLPLELALAESVSWEEEKAPLPSTQTDFSHQTTEPVSQIPRTAKVPDLAPAQEIPAKSYPIGEKNASPTPATNAGNKSSDQGSNMPQSGESAPSSNLGEGSINFQLIIKNWKKIYEIVRKNNSQSGGLLNSCSPLRFKDDVLVLGFTSDVLQQKMETGKHIDLTRQAITHLLGASIQIRCTVTDPSSKSDLSELDEDSGGMVNEALNLGGKIAHKKKTKPN